MWMADEANWSLLRARKSAPVLSQTHWHSDPGSDAHSGAVISMVSESFGVGGDVVSLAAGVDSRLIVGLDIGVDVGPARPASRGPGADA